MKLDKLFKDAQNTSWGLRKLNTALHLGIPFNKPHRLTISEIKTGMVKVRVPYIRKNLNHLKGIHACCLATAAEYSSGLVMLGILSPENYRLIMENISVDYHYQAKMPCAVTYEISEEEAKRKIIEPLQNQDRVSFVCDVKIFDTATNHICTAKITWQIKSWKAVKTAV